MKKTLAALVVLVGSFLFASTVFAQDSKPKLVTPLGMGLSVGGGWSDFLDSDVRDVTTGGGGFEARYVLGTRTYIGGEAAYVGTLNNVDALGLDSQALLLSNGVEGAVRFNVLVDEWQPYVLAGMGWKHYDIVNTDRNTSDLTDSTDAMTVPVGLGLAYRYANAFADIRGMYKPSFFADLLRVDQGTAGLDTYSAQLSIGIEF